MDKFKLQYDFVMNTKRDKQDEIKLQFGYKRSSTDNTSDNVMFINWINNQNEWKRLEELLYGNIVDENEDIKRRIKNYVDYGNELSELRTMMANEIENIVDELTKFDDWKYLLYNKEDGSCQFERFQNNLRDFEFRKDYLREYVIELADGMDVGYFDDEVTIFDSDGESLIRFDKNVPISLQIKERKAEYEEIQRYRNELKREQDLKKYNELRKKLFDND